MKTLNTIVSVIALATTISAFAEAVDHVEVVSPNRTMVTETIANCSIDRFVAGGELCESREVTFAKVEDNRVMVTEVVENCSIDRVAAGGELCESREVTFAKTLVTEKVTNYSLDRLAMGGELYNTFNVTYVK